MKDKYKLMSALRSIEYELNLLHCYCKECPDCYELVQSKLDKLCLFILDAENNELWNKWKSCDEIRQYGAQLRETAVRLLCDLEKHQSILVVNKELDAGQYLELLAESIREELRFFGMDTHSRLLFVGSGAFPLSAITIAKETGIHVMGIDIDEEAVDCGNRVAEATGMGDTVTFQKSEMNRMIVSEGATHVIIASLVRNKSEVLDQLKPMLRDHTKIIVRYGNGLKSLFNYSLEEHIRRDWKMTDIRRSFSIYDFAILEAKS
ncbi:cyclopropane-fatty-acyl-phospholipid synthase family protein [Paenibacillus sp. L3-i20]|uniref:SAM-dependent methyltransferase n=1 Tax=Paenibacillus sp. L3-i20 TaxID=2905833 RepID=UPI001EDCFB49|nr:nicotianamine synthase family protein [Paenibacillus sp. L3-i20]GKU78284.1 hypothetical protein L3i20_v226810 [Paenibacillus sp. L3-i20]